MALVSESVINRWFDPVVNSWVYRGFCYLFQNPLWHKNVPGGFSLCPYFWLSIFSWTFFRLFVFCLAYPSIALGKIVYLIFGKPALRLDAWLNKKLFYGELNKGMSLPAVLVLFIFALVLLFLFFVILVGFVTAWMAISSAFIKTLLAISILNLAVFIPSLIYTITKGDYSKRCKPLYYLLPVGIISLASLTWFFPAQVLWALTATGQALGMIGIAFLYGFWWLICKVGWALKLMAIGIGIGLKWIGIGIFAAICYSVAGLAIGVWFFLLGLLGMVVLKIAGRFELNNAEEQKEDKSITNYHWQAFAFECLTNSTKYIWFTELTDSIDRCLDITMEKFHRKRICKRIMNRIISDSIYGTNKIEVPKDLIGISQFDFEECKRGYEKNNCHANYAPSLHSYMRDIRRCINNSDIPAIVKKILKDDEDCRTLMEIYTQKYQAKQKRQDYCSKTTTAISKIGKGLASPFVMAWSGIVAIAKFLWFIVKEIGRLLVYIWIVAKAVKQGACPYRRFEHIEKLKNDNSN